MISLYKVIISIPLILNTLCILLIIKRKPSLEQKYALAVSFLTIFIGRGYYLVTMEQTYLVGLRIIYAIAIILMPLFIEINSLIFNVHISRRIFTVIASFTLFAVFVLILSYDSNIFIDKILNSALTLYYLYAISMVVFTVAIFIFRMITCRKNERFFFIRHFIMCILPLLSLCFINVNKVFFFLPPYMLSCFIASITILILQEKFSNLSDQALFVVENAVPGPCFIVDEKFMVHDANLAAVQMFPEYLSVRKLMKKPVKANDLLMQVIFNATNAVHSKDNIFEVDDKQYQGSCVAIKSDFRFYGYSVVLQDITAQTDVVLKLERRNEQQKQILRYYEDEISSIQSKIVSGLMQLLFAADRETGEHIRRISNYTNVIARQLLLEGKFSNTLTDRYVEVLTKISPLHDIGKIKISKKNSPSSSYESGISYLSDAESQRHVISGAEIIDSLILNNPDDLFYSLSKEVTLYHHEWWDGEGYPKGLKGYEIPLAARIVAVADVFDSVSFREYKQSHRSNFAQVFNSIVLYSGKRFDPAVIDAFKNAKSKIEKLYDEMLVEDLSLNGVGDVESKRGGGYLKIFNFM